MKTGKVKKSTRILEETILIISAMLLGGCGEAESLPEKFIDENETVEPAPVEADIVASDSSSHGTLISPAFLALLDLQRKIENIPESAFKKTRVGIPPVSIPRKGENKLIAILNKVNEEIQNNNFIKASSLLEKKFAPLVDGSSGGDPENDIIRDRRIAFRLFKGSKDIAGEISAATSGGRKPPVKDMGRTANIYNWEVFKSMLIRKLDNLIMSISNAPGGVFESLSNSGRQTLLDTIDTAKFYVELGDYAAARREMEQNFYKAIDGGRGGDMEDDVINGTYYTAPGYVSLAAAAESFSAPVELTSL